MKYTININNTENDNIVKSYNLEFQPDNTGFTEVSELEQLEQECRKEVRLKMPNFDEPGLSWEAVVYDESGEEVGRFPKTYVER